MRLSKILQTEHSEIIVLFNSQKRKIEAQQL